jgi:hypothetical protein
MREAEDQLLPVFGSCYLVYEILTAVFLGCARTDIVSKCEVTDG